MHLSPDDIIFWDYGFLKLNATIVYTWMLMLVLAGGSKMVTRKLSVAMKRSRWQNFLEIVVLVINKQIEEAGLRQAHVYLGFLGTLFLFVAAASLFTIIPGYEAPTGSLSTTTALAICVFIAVPMYGIKERGISRLSAILSQTDAPHASFQYYGRAVAHTCSGCSPVRQYDERNNDTCNSSEHFAVYFSGHYECARFIDRYGSGLYLQYSRHGLHRCRYQTRGLNPVGLEL